MVVNPDETTPESAEHPRSQRRGVAAADALRAYIRDLAEREFVPQARQGGPLGITLDLRVNPDDEWALEFSPSLREQVYDQLAEAFVERAAYQPGRVHCFRCGTSSCEHAQPPAPTSVFQGYASTGQPEWHDLSQALLRLRDDRIDQLYARPPRVVACVEAGRELKARQLSSFGKSSKAYAILGQVVCGYFAPDESVRSGADSAFAITFQFVESRTPTGDVALRVNALCSIPGDGDLEELFASGWGGWVRRAHRKAEQSLESLARRINQAGPDRFRVARAVMTRIPIEMRTLAQSIDRGHRQSRRRTRHAEKRREEKRPIQMALKDLENANDGDLMLEERSDAIVVPGPQGRLHLFSREGRHVTSFNGKPGTVEQRLRSKRWAPLNAEAAQGLRAAVRER